MTASTTNGHDNSVCPYFPIFLPVPIFLPGNPSSEQNVLDLPTRESRRNQY